MTSIAGFIRKSVFSGQYGGGLVGLAIKTLGISQEGNSWQMTKISEFIRKLAIILKRKERAGCFALIIILMTCDCKCSLALHLGVMGWSAWCECGISCSYALLLFSNKGMELFTLLIMCLLVCTS